MDIQAIVKELKRERERISKAIAALEETDLPAVSRKASPAAILAAPTKRGHGLTPDGRKRLSDAMKKRWVERRKKAPAMAKKPAVRR